jgi:hypothetical protein
LVGRQIAGINRDMRNLGLLAQWSGLRLQYRLTRHQQVTKQEFAGEKQGSELDSFCHF